MAPTTETPTSTGTATPPEHSSSPEHHRIVIVGSGFSGLGAAIRLKQEGIHDFVVLEKADDLGGTWRDNTYPGCGCDVPSHLYSFSFAPNPDWSRTFSGQPEIWDYLRRTSREHGVEPHMRYRHEVTSADWDGEAELWRIDTSAGPLTANLLVAGPGPLSEPKLPDVAGIDSFEGEIFHSARWNHDYDLRGKRVAVVGTGASTIQFLPKIQPQVKELHLFQRTPPWVMPSRNRRISRLERSLYRAFPPAQKAMRAAIYWARELFVLNFMHPRAGSPGERIAGRHLARQVEDPALRAKLKPRYRMGCKRVLIANDYYPALRQPNVEVIAGGVREIKANSIVSEDGLEREVEAIILGTGFHVTDMPVGAWIRGVDGHTMDDVWRGSPQAYLGTAVAGFPNMFMLVGPNTGLGHTSIVFMIESQLNYLVECVRFIDRSAVGVLEIRKDVQESFNADLQRQLQGSVWNSGGCASWYIDEQGKNTTIWPGFTWPFRRRTRHFEPGDYHQLPRTSISPASREAAAIT
jgi:cation diffusion facilitator CzcD-associated flavoprotein CzcO